MDTINFFTGLLIGLFAAILGGWIWNLYQGWVKTRDAYKKPQIVIHTTSKTPAQVGKEADRAQIKIMLFWIFLVIALWLAVELFIPEMAQLIRILFESFWNVLLG
jgi:hypothetical protein